MSKAPSNTEQIINTPQKNNVTKLVEDLGHFTKCAITFSVFMLIKHSLNIIYDYCSINESRDGLTENGQLTGTVLEQISST